MTHADDDGLVLPPKVAPTVAAIVPIFRGAEERRDDARRSSTSWSRSCAGGAGARAAHLAATASRATSCDREPQQQIVVDLRDNRPGDKQYHWEQRGVPFRIEVGPRDVAAGAFVLKKRLDRSKEIVQLGDASRAWLVGQLDQVQTRHVREGARVPRREHARRADSYDEMKQILSEQGGFVRCFFKPDRADRGQDQGRDQGDGALHPVRAVGRVGALHLHGRADGYRSAVRGRLLRCAARRSSLALLAGGCVSDAAARRVQIVGGKPEGCRVVAERLRGAGRDANAGVRAPAARGGARRRRSGRRHRRAAQRGRTRSVVDAIGYACAAPAR